MDDQSLLQQLLFLWIAIPARAFFQPLHLLPSAAYRGVSPQDLAFYGGVTIPCKDGSRTFHRDRLNDDFCDCVDGTDEPGTSACPHGKFYCENAGQTPLLIFSSRVNDGICDCCDGSDEYDGKVKCFDTCSGSGKATPMEGTVTSAEDNGSKRVANEEVKESFSGLKPGKKSKVMLENYQNYLDVKLVLLLEMAAVCFVFWSSFHWWRRQRRTGRRRRLPH